MAVVWTGTRRISKSSLKDEFGQVFTKSEFTKNIGAKDQI